MLEKETTLVQAGFGNDNIHADDGDDAVFAGANDDYENGGNGNDELYAQDGDDVLEGGPEGLTSLTVAWDLIR